MGTIQINYKTTNHTLFTMHRFSLTVQFSCCYVHGAVIFVRQDRCLAQLFVNNFVYNEICNNSTYQNIQCIWSQSWPIHQRFICIYFCSLVYDHHYRMFLMLIVILVLFLASYVCNCIPYSTIFCWKELWQILQIIFCPPNLPSQIPVPS